MVCCWFACSIKECAGFVRAWPDGEVVVESGLRGDGLIVFGGSDISGMGIGGGMFGRRLITVQHCQFQWVVKFSGARAFVVSGRFLSGGVWVSCCRCFVSVEWGIFPLKRMRKAGESLQVDLWGWLCVGVELQRVVMVVGMGFTSGKFFIYNGGL